MQCNRKPSYSSYSAGGWSRLGVGRQSTVVPRHTGREGEGIEGQRAGERVVSRLRA